jgi:hypothetical protein
VGHDQSPAATGGPFVLRVGVASFELPDYVAAMPAIRSLAVRSVELHPPARETDDVSRVESWFEERTPRAEIASALARDRFWRDEQRRLIGTHPDFPDAAMLLGLGDELAHALLLVLSRLPAERRTGFARSFYDQRTRTGAGSAPSDPAGKHAVAAAIASLVVELAPAELQTARIVDLLDGAAQGDDLALTPEPALRELRTTLARIRFDVELEDPADPRGAAAHAIAEVLDPAGEVVALQAVLARAAWAAAESWDAPRTLAFLLDVDRLFGAAGG